MQTQSAIKTDRTRVERKNLSSRFHADPQTEYRWGGVDLEAALTELADDIYGFLVVPEDVPAVLDNIPVDDLGEDSPAFLTHTAVFNSKFDLRCPEDGKVITQINFGSIPSDAQILDLRQVKIGLFERA